VFPSRQSWNSAPQFVTQPVYDPFYDPQSNTRSPLALGREERLEDRLLVLRRNPASGVTNRDLHLFRNLTLDCDLDSAVSLCSVDGIADQVVEYLSQLAGMEW